MRHKTCMIQFSLTLHMYTYSRFSAPRGKHIRLIFRDNFHIEVSGNACDYDFLELRDGPFGYSPLLGRFCGKSPPAILDTSGRFLWIRFKSDESIEYSGFKIQFLFRELSGRWSTWRAIILSDIPCRRNNGVSLLDFCFRKSKSAWRWEIRTATVIPSVFNYKHKCFASVCQDSLALTSLETRMTSEELRKIDDQTIRQNRTIVDCTFRIGTAPHKRVS